jgi:hypothetical protein
MFINTKFVSRLYEDHEPNIARAPYPAHMVIIKYQTSY